MPKGGPTPAARRGSRSRCASSRARAAPSPSHPQLPAQAPVAYRQPHELHAHGGVRVDPYYWLGDAGRTNPAVLRHLQAENRYTSAALLPCTRLQSLAEGVLSGWQWQQLLQQGRGEQQQQQPTGAPPPRRSVHPDFLLGGERQGDACRAAGPAHPVDRGDHTYVASLQPGSGRVQLFRRPVAAAAAAAAPGGAPAPPPAPPWQLVFDEQARAAALGWAGYELHTLSISPDGRLLAVTERPAGGGGGGSSRGSWQLALLTAADGRPAAGAAHVEGVDGPICWTAASGREGRPSSDDAQLLLFVGSAGRELCCLTAPPAGGVGAGGGAWTRSRLWTERAGAFCSLLPLPGAGGGTGRGSNATDSSSSSGACALLCSHAAHRAPMALQTCQGSGAGVQLRPLQLPDHLQQHPADACAQLLPSLCGDWLLLRCHTAAQPSGVLLAAPLPLQTAAPGWQLLLPHDPRNRLEAVMAAPTPQPPQGPPPAAPAASAACIVLLSQRCDAAGAPLGLLARRYSLQPGSAAAVPPPPQRYSPQQPDAAAAPPQPGARLQLWLASEQEVPLGVPFWQLHAAEWWAAAQQLHVWYSSLTLPCQEVSVPLPAGGWGAAGEGAAAPPGCSSAPSSKYGMSAPPGFSGAAYGADQACAVAADGQLVRISIAYKRPPGAGAGSTATSSPTTIGSHQQHPGSSRPLLLRAYGSYGLREAVAFDPATLLALDMGLGVAVAHVRGGGWGGPAWQHAGSGLSKHVAVADLAACARHLVQAGYAAPGGICLQGASAGAWLAASTLLAAPACFRAAVLTVPCLDVLTSAWEGRLGAGEWGDVRGDARAFAAVAAWSPYDVLGEWDGAPDPPAGGAATAPGGAGTPAAQAAGARGGAGAGQLLDHQHVYVRAAVDDLEVGYWEAAKFAARLRHLRHQWAQQAQAQRSQQDAGTSAAPAGSSGVGTQAAAGLVLLRMQRGGHNAFLASAREDAALLAFLAGALLAPAAPASSAGEPGGEAATAALGPGAQVGLGRLQASAVVVAAVRGTPESAAN